MKESFPERLRSIRLGKGISQEVLGNFLGVDKSTISLYESGKRKPDYEIIEKIALYFDISTDYLLGLTNQLRPENPVIGNIPLKEIEFLSDESLKELESYIRLLKIKDEMDKGKTETLSTLEKNA